MPGLIDPKALDAHIQSWQSPAKAAPITSVPQLNQALHAGKINQQQWNQQFKVLQAKAQPTPKINTSVGANLNPFNKQSALHQAINKVVLGPAKDIALATPRAAKSTGKQIEKQFKYLSGPTSTQKERTSIIQNQQKAQTAAPKTQEMFKQAPAHAKVEAANLLAKGHKESAVQTYLNKQIALGNQQTMTGLSNAAVLSSVNVAGGGLLSKAVSTAKAATGKDAAVNGLIDAQRVSQGAELAKKAETTQKLGKATVDEAKITRVPVTGESTKVVGKPVSVSDTAYVKQSQQLSKAYDKEINALKTQPTVVQKLMQAHIDTKYQNLQQKLDDSAGKTSFAFGGKPTKASAPATKATSSSTTVANPVIDGAKISGSALRTEQKAVQAGMKSESAGKATYATVSHKEEAAKAVDLLHNDPEKAMKIAMGEAAGNNSSHEAAVYHAVANDALQQAKKTGDYSTVTRLASSPRHTGVSEAAQKLGAEGYNVNPHDPIKLMNDVSKTREAAVAKRTGSTVAKEAVNVSKQVKSNTLKVSRQDWNSFVESLKC